MIVVENLESLKYADLQKLAKQAGIKANQKIDKLVKALKDYYLDADEVKMDSSSEAKSSGSDQLTSPDDCIASSTNDDKRRVRKAKRSRRKHTEKAPEGSTEMCLDVLPAKCSTSKRVVPEKFGSGQRFKPSLKQSPQVFSPAVKSKLASKATPTPLSSNKRSHLAIKDKTPDCAKKPKRRRTFELDEPTLSAENTPIIDGHPKKRGASETTTPSRSSDQVPSTKRIRRDTYVENTSTQQVKTSQSSPGTIAIIDSMDTSCSSAERKAKLLSALDKKVQSKVASPFQAASQGSQIPRFMAFLANKKKPGTSKPVTPGNKDWTKVHEKAFSKFDSIDVYLEKKQQRMEKLTGSTKRPTQAKSPAQKKGPLPGKPAQKLTSHSKSFKPTVVSTKNLSFNFSKTGPDSKTPSRQAVTKTPVTGKSVAKREATGTTSRATPFKFTGNTSSLNTTVTIASHKKVFDLKASLARPITWKPHTGKLQPLDINNPLTAPPGKSSRVSLKAVRSSHQSLGNRSRPVQAKDVRRNAQLDRRNNQKYIDMMKRRGLMA